MWQFNTLHEMASWQQKWHILFLSQYVLMCWSWNSKIWLLLTNVSKTIFLMLATIPAYHFLKPRISLLISNLYSFTKFCRASDCCVFDCTTILSSSTALYKSSLSLLSRLYLIIWVEIISLGYIHKLCHFLSGFPVNCH